MRNKPGLGLFCFLSLLSAGASAEAKEPPPPAYVVAEAETGKALDSRLAQQPRHPASLTKLMTLYLTFQAVREKRANWATNIKTSAHAAAQTGSLLGLKKGEMLSLKDAATAVAIRSANDAAVALAEYLAGSEENFAKRMTEQAAKLGLAATRFRNATGLSAEGQLTTAADMLTLAMAIKRDFPDDYPLFSKRSFVWKKSELPNLNGFLSSYAGAEGLKTGFTCPAGYNLVAAAKQGGKRLIGVVLGASSKEERENLMAQNLNRAFKEPDAKAPAKERPSSIAPDLSATVCPGGVLPGGYGGGNGSAPSGWGLELAFGRQAAKVRQELQATQKQLGKAVASGQPRLLRQPMSGEIRYRGLLTGLSETAAVKTCLDYRAKGGDCLVLPPQAVQGAYDVQRELALSAARE